MRPFRPLLALVAALGVALPAQADFHLMKVTEVFTGTPAAPNAQYVVIQMYAANQGNVLNHDITVYNASGTLVDTFTFGSSPTNPQSAQEKIFIATPEAVTFFNLAADLTMEADMLAAGGKACFDAIPEDCVAWGAWTGSSTGVGTPVAPNGIPTGRAVIRRLDIAGSPTLLEAADDTNVCSNDFVVGLPAPRNSNALAGTIPASTCGNGVVEGVEQCDDDNTANGDSCSSVCEFSTPSTTLSINDVALAEGNAGTKLFTFTVSLNVAAGGDVVFDVATANGTATTAGNDYTALVLADQVIPAGMLSKTVSVAVKGDTAVEANETFFVNVSGVTGAGVADAQGVGTITNDDSPVLSIFDASITEGNAGTKTLSFLVRIDRASTQNVVFDIATSDDTASVANADYVALNLTGQTIPAGTLTKNFLVTINGNTAVEPNEKFNLTLGNVANATLGDGAAVGTIINDDGPTLSIADVSAVELDAGTTTYNFVARLSQAAAADVTFNIQTVQQTATAGSDYVTRIQAAQKILAGQLTFPFAVTVNGDTAVEPNEAFLVLINGVSGPITVADDRASGIIVNNEGPTLSIADVSLAEGNAGTQTATFTIALSQAAPTTVSFSASTVAFSAAAGSDFVGKTLHNQQIPAGMLSRTFTVTVNGDTTVEANEQFIVLINNTVGASAFDDRAFGRIVNDDGPTLSVADVAVTEGNSGTRLMSFIVRLSQAAAGPVTYTIATFDGTATGAGNDYTPRTLTGETIAAGATARSFSVTIKGDTAVEANETFGVRLSAATGATIADDTATGTITNDDGATLSINNAAVSEGNAGTRTLTFTVSLSQAAAGPVTYTASTSNGTCTAGADYVAKTLSGETIPAGQLSRTFTVTLNGDTTVEPNETMWVYLSDAAGASILDGEGLGTITNDDVPTISIADVNEPEGQAGAKNFSFAVSLSQAPLAPVVFDIATAAGTATAGVDYTTKALNDETIAAGVTSKVFTVSVAGDTTSEPDETFLVNLSGVTGATVADAQATGTIADDDGSPPTISVSDAQVDEGHSGTKQMGFTVSLSFAAATDVTYSIATADSTANSPGDYAARSLTGETIPAGETSRTFFVTINGDVAVEGDEELLVNLGAVTGATVLDGQGSGEITNDDVVDPYSIPTIQGDGPVSKYAGRGVETEGVVTALAGGGFFLQSAAGDGDDATSDGLFATGVAGSPVAVGDLVRVRGLVEEARVGDSLAQLTQTRLRATSLRVLATGVDLPGAVRPDARALQPGASPTALERYEGMRLALPAMTVVAPVDADPQGPGDGRFHVVAAGVPRPFREPGVSLLDGVAMAVGKAPPRFDANAEVLRITSAGQRGAVPLAVDAGDRVAGLVGVLDYAQARYQLLPDPRAAIVVDAGATPHAVAAAAANEATFARFALDGYLAGAKRGEAAYAARVAKAAQVVCRWLQAPAVVALPGDDDASVLADLAAQVSRPASGCTTDPRYRVHAQRGTGLGLLLSQAVVAGGAPRAQLLAAGPFALANRFVAPDGTATPLFADAPQRLRLQLHAADGTALPFTALAVRFVALDGALAAPGTHGWATRGEALRAQRRAQALLLARVVQARQHAAPGEKLAVFGGFGAPEFNEGHEHVLGIVTGRTAAPERVLHAIASPVAPPLANLTYALPALERYTTTAGGDAQTLDHVLVNAALVRAWTARVQPARINADFGADNAGDATVPLRVAGSDPLVLYLAPRRR